MPKRLYLLFLIPAIATTLFIWVFPHLEFWAFKAVQKARVKRRNARLNLQGDGVIDAKLFLETKRTLDESLMQYSKTMNEAKKIKEEKRNLSGENIRIQTELDRVKEQVKLTDKENFELKKEIQTTNPSLEDFFKRRWRCEWILPNGKQDSEIFRIQNSFHYFKGKDTEPSFFIDQVIIDKHNKRVLFRKVREESNRTVIYTNDLQIYDDGNKLKGIQREIEIRSPLFGKEKNFESMLKQNQSNFQFNKTEMEKILRWKDTKTNSENIETTYIKLPD